MTVRPVTFRDYVLDLPEDWISEPGESALLAALPEDGPFTQNLVVQVVDDAVGPATDLRGIGGCVVLARGRSPGFLPAEEIVFGYPLPAGAVTAVQLVGDPTPGGRLLVTYSADATRFVDHWPAAERILRSIRSAP